MREYAGVSVSGELQRALAELLEIGWQSIVAYRAAADVVTHPRVEAALHRLRLDHERHVHELEAVLADLDQIPGAVGTRPGPSGDGDVGRTRAGGPGMGTRIAELTGVWEEVRCAIGDRPVWEALRRAEKAMEAAYAVHTRRGHVEPLGAMLRRHRREEEAHVNWLHESALWRDLDAQEDLQGEVGRVEPLDWAELNRPDAPDQPLDTDSQRPSSSMGRGL